MCAIERDVRFTCDEGNSCCIPKLTEKLTKEQKELCVVGNDKNEVACGVQKKCTQIVDPCLVFDDELNCSKESGCSFIPDHTNGKTFEISIFTALSVATYKQSFSTRCWIINHNVSFIPIHYENEGYGLISDVPERTCFL